MSVSSGEEAWPGRESGGYFEDGSPAVWKQAST